MALAYALSCTSEPPRNEFKIASAKEMQLGRSGTGADTRSGYSSSVRPFNFLPFFLFSYSTPLLEKKGHSICLALLLN